MVMAWERRRCARAVLRPALRMHLLRWRMRASGSAAARGGGSEASRGRGGGRRGTAADVGRASTTTPERVGRMTEAVISAPHMCRHWLHRAEMGMQGSCATCVVSAAGSLLSTCSAAAAWGVTPSKRWGPLRRRLAHPPHSWGQAECSAVCMCLRHHRGDPLRDGAPRRTPSCPLVPGSQGARAPKGLPRKPKGK